jgi:hypothetical protein
MIDTLILYITLIIQLVILGLMATWEAWWQAIALMDKRGVIPKSMIAY